MQINKRKEKRLRRQGTVINRNKKRFWNKRIKQPENLFKINKKSIFSKFFERKNQTKKTQKTVVQNKHAEMFERENKRIKQFGQKLRKKPRLQIKRLTREDKKYKII